MTISSDEAKALVALAFRNGPIENLHAGKACPTCQGDSDYSHISDDEMKLIMKHAVNWLHTLLRLKTENPEAYAAAVRFGNMYTARWDEPEPVDELRPRPRPAHRGKRPRS